MAKDRDISIEQSLPIVDINGLNTNKDTYLGGTLEVVGIATFDATPVFAGANFSGAVDVAGALGVGGALTATGAISSVSTVSALNASAITATGAQAMGVSNISDFGIYYGSGIPTISAATGSLYLRSDGGGATNRMYVASSGTGGWASFTSSS
jgi:hypothetical protein